jgi:uncharacterized protein (TIGR02118 family)
MPKVIIIYGTPADVGLFDRHFNDVHVPLAIQLPGLKKFEMSEGPVVSPMGFGGVHLVATLYFDDMETLYRALDSPEGKAAAMDAEKLMAPGSGMLILESRVV